MPSALCARILIWAIAPLLLTSAICQTTTLLIDRKQYIPAYGADSVESALRMIKKLITPSNIRDLDSWYPMMRALAAARSETAADIYHSTILDPQLAPADKARYQYPPSALLIMEGLIKSGILSPSYRLLDGVIARDIRIRSNPFLASDFKKLNIMSSIFLVCSCICASILAFILLNRDLQGNFTNTDRRYIITFTGLIGFFFYPISQGILLGQIQIWLDSIVMLTCVMWVTDRRALAIVLLSVCCAVKPQYVIVAPWLLAWKQWRLLTIFLSAGIVIAGISVVDYGYKNFIGYFEVLQFLNYHGESFVWNSSANGLAHRFIFNGDNLFYSFSFLAHDSSVYIFTMIFNLFILAVVLLASRFWSKSEEVPSILDLGVLIVGATIASPIAWDHHYGVIFPFFIIAGYYIIKNGLNKCQVTLLVISWTLVSGNITFLFLTAYTRLNILESYRLFGAMILLGLLVAIRRRDPNSKLRSTKIGGKATAANGHTC